MHYRLSLSLVTRWTRLAILLSPASWRVFQDNNPPVRRYRTTWDVDLVLCYLSSLPEPSHLSLKCLTLKTAMLIVHVSAQKGWSLHLLDKKEMKEGKLSLSFLFRSTLKKANQHKKCHLYSYAPTLTINPFEFLITRKNILRGQSCCEALKQSFAWATQSLMAVLLKIPCQGESIRICQVLVSHTIPGLQPGWTRENR